MGNFGSLSCAANVIPDLVPGLLGESGSCSALTCGFWSRPLGGDEAVLEVGD